jgi:hypothetical protein
VSDKGNLTRQSRRELPGLSRLNTRDVVKILSHSRRVILPVFSSDFSEITIFVHFVLDNLIGLLYDFSLRLKTVNVLRGGAGYGFGRMPASFRPVKRRWLNAKRIEH